MKKAIEVTQLSKQYKINPLRSETLTGTFNNWLKPKMKKQSFWAVKDVSFDVEQGETVGLVGKNGAGKSTILKILSRITYPTRGKAFINGRISSLLEIGTGFHPELTGMENIYLNGSLLGLKRNEIKQKLEEIIDFSGVEKFINTPLKHYSSGMYVRLGFAVAAYLKAEILLIDEVLSVGDAEFQRKCIRSIKEINESGRTVLFVSHNLGVLRKVCKKSLLLQSGQLTDFGPTDEIIKSYLSEEDTRSAVELDGIISRIEVKSTEDDLNFYISYNVDHLDFPNIDAVISNRFGQSIMGCNTRYLELDMDQEFTSKGIIEISFKNVALRSDHYYFSIYFGTNKASHLVKLKDVLLFSYSNLKVKAGNLNAEYYGHVVPKVTISAGEIF